MAQQTTKWPSVNGVLHAILAISDDHPKLFAYSLRLVDHTGQALECGQTVATSYDVQLWARDNAVHRRPMDVDHLFRAMASHGSKKVRIQAHAAWDQPLLTMYFPSPVPSGVATAIPVRWMAADADRAVLTFAPLTLIEESP